MNDKQVRKPSLLFGVITTIVFFIGFFLLASRNDAFGNYFLYAGMVMGVIYWIWSIIVVGSAHDLKKYQKSFWMIIIVAVPFFGALIYNILHQNPHKMVA